MLTWIKSHPYLTGALIVGVLLLWILWKDLSSASSATATTTTGTAVDPNADALEAMQLQYGSAIQQSQIAAQAQVAGYNSANATAALAANAQNTQTLAAAGVSNLQTTSALTLGLAQQGESTPSILSLLQGQINPFAAQQGMVLTSGVPSTTATTTTTINPTVNQTVNPPVSSNTGAASVTSSNVGGLWPTANAQGLNDVANNLAQSESGWATEVAPTPITITDNQGVGLPGNSCPAGYYFLNGQCLSADASPAISSDLAQISDVQSQGYTLNPELGYISPAVQAAQQHGAAA